MLLGDIGWRADRRQMYDREVAVPRLLRWYAGGEALPHPLLTEARADLDAHYLPELGEPFVSAGMCLYRDGRDSVAWHGDRIGRGRSQDTMVAIVSFGSPRALMLRPVGGGASIRFPLGHGDLVVMGGSCQRTWEHCIPKTSTARRPTGQRPVPPSRGGLRSRRPCSAPRAGRRDPRRGPPCGHPAARASGARVWFSLHRETPARPRGRAASQTPRGHELGSWSNVQQPPEDEGREVGVAARPLFENSTACRKSVPYV